MLQEVLAAAQPALPLEVPIRQPPAAARLLAPHAASVPHGVERDHGIRLRVESALLGGSGGGVAPLGTGLLGHSGGCEGHSCADGLPTGDAGDMLRTHDRAARHARHTLLARRRRNEGRAQRRLRLRQPRRHLCRSLA
eukprot:scaffold73455_cov67-Phaeocystis_antarctica.AAC.12